MNIADYITDEIDAQTERNGAFPFLSVDMDGDVSECSMVEFFEHNADMDAIEIRDILELRVGQTYHGGGGAACEWSVTRIA